MFKFLTKLLEKPKLNTEKKETNKFLSTFAKTGACPDCGSEEFLQGPQGGLSINIKYANPECGSKFNLGVYCGTVIQFDRI